VDNGIGERCSNNTYNRFENKTDRMPNGSFIKQGECGDGLPAGNTLYSPAGPFSGGEWKTNRMMKYLNHVPSSWD
jgi:hypothetical protein